MEKLRFRRIVPVLVFCIALCINLSSCNDSGFVSLTEIEIKFIPEYFSPERNMYSSISVRAKCNRKNFYRYDNYLSEKIIGIEVMNTITGESLDSILRCPPMPITEWDTIGIELWFTSPLSPGRYKFQLSLVLDDGRRLTDETDEIEITAVPEE